MTAPQKLSRYYYYYYGCNDNLLCGHGVVERNRISSLESHGKALEKDCCLPGVIVVIIFIIVVVSTSSPGTS